MAYRSRVRLLYQRKMWDSNPRAAERPNAFRVRPLNQTWVTFHKMNVLNTSDILSLENLATSDFS